MRHIKRNGSAPNTQKRERSLVRVPRCLVEPVSSDNRRPRYRRRSRLFWWYVLSV